MKAKKYMIQPRKCLLCSPGNNSKKWFELSWVELSRVDVESIIL